MSKLASSPESPPLKSLQIGMTVLPALMVAGLWAPPTWLWGLNHTRWLPWPAQIGLPLVCLILIWTPLGTRLGSWLVDRLEPVLLGRRAVGYLIVPLLGAAVFWLYADPTHLLGDGQTLAVMLTKGRLFHGFDGGTYHLLARAWQLGGGGGKVAAFQVMAVCSWVAGAAYLAAAAWSARRLAVDGASRILLYGLLVLAAVLQLFMGYAEVYAPLSVALLVFLTFLILFLTGRASFRPLAVAWSVALFLHLNALFLAPLLVVAVFWRDESGGVPWLRRLVELIVSALVALLALWVLYRTAGYDLAAIGADFGPSAGGGRIFRTWAGPDGILVWRQAKDVLNLLLLLAPVPLVLLSVNFRKLPAQSLTAAAAKVCLAGTGWLVLLMIVVHTKLGMARDWDLLVPHASLVVLAGWLLVSVRLGAAERAGRIVGPVLGVAALVVVPWLVVNAGESSAVARLDAVTSDLAPYPRGLIHEQMAYHFELQKNPAEIERHYRRAAEICPKNLRFQAIYGTYMLNQGEIDQAIAIYDQALAADSTYVYGLQMAVTARALSQDFSTVLPLARRLKRLGFEDARAAEAHGIAAEQVGLTSEAIAAYRRAAAQDPARLELLARAGGLALQTRAYSQAEGIFRAVLQADPQRSQASVGLANAIWLDCQARPRQAGVQARLVTVVELIDRVLARPGLASAQADDLRRWRSEVSGVLSGLAE